MFSYYVKGFPGLLFCVKAHDHRLSVEDIFGDGVIYYGIDCAEHRNWILFTITPDGYEYEVVHI